MLSQYTWGQFFLFVVVLLVLYYVVVGFMYYQDEIGALLKGQKPPSRPAGATAGSAPPSLVRSKSAFVATPGAVKSRPTAAAPSADERAGDDEPEADRSLEAGAATNLPQAAAVIVGGKLPRSTAIPTSEPEDPTSSASETTTAETTDEEAAAYAEEEPDLRNQELADLIRKKVLLGAMSNATDSTPESETAPEPISIAKNNTDAVDIETTRTSFAENEVQSRVAYHATNSSDYEPLADFDEPFAATQDVEPVAAEDLFEANHVCDFIAQAQAGLQPPVPAVLLGTDLAELAAPYTSAGQL